MIFNYRRLNYNCHEDAYKVSNKEQLINEIQCLQWYLKFDFKYEFWQVRMHMKSVQLDNFHMLRRIFRMVDHAFQSKNNTKSISEEPQKEVSRGAKNFGRKKMSSFWKINSLRNNKSILQVEDSSRLTITQLRKKGLQYLSSSCGHNASLKEKLRSI